MTTSILRGPSEKRRLTAARAFACLISHDRSYSCGLAGSQATVVANGLLSGLMQQWVHAALAGNTGLLEGPGQGAGCVGSAH